MHPGIETLWSLFPSYGKFIFGLVEFGVDHKDFVAFKDKFEKVGTLKKKVVLKNRVQQAESEALTDMKVFLTTTTRNKKYSAIKNFLYLFCVTDR